MTGTSGTHEIARKTQESRSPQGRLKNELFAFSFGRRHLVLSERL